ncbi:hypothetical protein JK636_20655 [Clostridium sp. YIM B02515]|uniref:Capsule polysaccharide biosynthesis protein n=1 Tax=Clostridium rhizosphaerae TaxID=2803861 RepID=A0ABS1TFG5_9CLOT|nr:hypothetical protein [Clostridium rhizosphaerae]MBL4938128.1 hypothetical protein [Clostridium rhizosphaerae]
MIEIIYTDVQKTISNNNKIINLFDFTGSLSVDEVSFDFIQYLEGQMTDNKTIEDFFTYDGIPMYFFVRPTLYGKLKNIIFFIELMKNIVNNESDKYLLKTDDKVLYTVAKDLFKIRAEMVESEIQITKRFDFKYYFGLAKRYIKGSVNLFKFSFRGTKGRTLALTHSADINFINNDDYRGYFDTQLGKAINKLKISNNVLELQLLSSRSQIDKASQYKNEYCPFEFFILYKRLVSKKLVDETKIKDYTSYFQSLNYTYKKYDIKAIVFETLINFKKECLNYLIEILAAERFIKKYKFVKCLIAGEGDRGRCFVVASHRAGVPCYAVQHGIINETSPNYIIKSKGETNIVPTISFLWGRRYQNMLLNNTSIYSNANTVIVGQARTDLLKQYKDRLDNNSKKIRILYATQYLKDLLEPATEMLFKALKLLETEYELIIKLHPADNYTDFYNTLIENYNIKNASIIKDQDLYNLISWCDIIISVHSTVVLEGALMGKPSICILLPKYNDEGGFVKDGISLGVSDEYKLAEYLSSRDFGYMNKMKLYIEDNFYAVDGNVADRIVRVINSSDKYND